MHTRTLIPFFVLLILGFCASSLRAFAGSSDLEKMPPTPMAVLYVTVDGKPAGNGSFEHPFESLEQARDAVRLLTQHGMRGDIVVEVGPGDYFLDQPFRLGVADSGRDGFQVIYRAAAGAKTARLIGGVVLDAWQRGEDGLFRARVPSQLRFDTLYEEGVRARKARFPNYEFDARFPLSGAGYLTAAKASKKGFFGREGDLDSIRGSDLEGGLVAVVWPWGYADWQKLARRVDGVDFSQDFVSLPDHDQRGAPPISEGSRYYLEGAAAFLDQPGEFHLDDDSGILTYWPRFGDPRGREIIIPRLDSVIVLEGVSESDPVRNIMIEGFTVAYTDTYPYLKGPTHFPWAPADPFGVLGEGAYGTFQLRYTEGVALRFNHIKGSGMSAIYLDRSNKEDVIYGNWIEDAGISGIVFAFHREVPSHPQDSNDRNRVENNLIQRLGVIGVDSAGINLWGGSGNQILHNEISDGARYAISIRGPYSQMKMTDGVPKVGNTRRSRTADNQISYNYFHRLGQDSGDAGAIHMAGISSQNDHPVNRLEQLLITDIAAHPSMKDIQPNGIFFDYTEGVTDQELIDIEVRHTSSPFRTNRTDFRHVYQNVSWREDFDPSRMHYDQIGLRADFPENFAAPKEIGNLRVEELSGADERQLRLDWTPPLDLDYAGVWIASEGVVTAKPVFVPAGRDSMILTRPADEHPFALRLMTVDDSGNRSAGILAPAAEMPDSPKDLVARGIEGGIEILWEAEASAGDRLVAKAARVNSEVSASVHTGRMVLSDLRNGEVVDLSIERVDADGYFWPVSNLQVAAGTAAPVPQDAVAWWTFEETELHPGKSLGDRSGAGHTLFVEGDGLSIESGRFGKAVRFTGDGSHLRVLDPTGLELEKGDYAVSVWIAREASTRMAGRVLDFGGGSQGVWEQWGTAESEDPHQGGGFALITNDYSVGALLSTGEGESLRLAKKGYDLMDGWHHLVLNVRRGKRLEIWLDGSLVASNALGAKFDGLINPTAEFIIGRKTSPEHRNLLWTGLIDQVRVYRRSLDPTEIAALFSEPTAEISSNASSALKTSGKTDPF